MALIKCPECGNEVSDQAKTCIHCGAPLNVQNGTVKIKCGYLNGSLMKAKIVDLSTGDTLAKLSQNEVVEVHIKRDTSVEISFFGYKSVKGTLKYAGQHNYAISATSGFLLPKLVLNEVTNIDSD